MVNKIICTKIDIETYESLINDESVKEILTPLTTSDKILIENNIKKLYLIWDKYTIFYFSSKIEGLLLDFEDFMKILTHPGLKPDWFVHKNWN
jgi:hypothetical protein